MTRSKSLSRWLLGEVGQDDLAVLTMSLALLAIGMIALALVQSDAQPVDSGLLNIFFYLIKFSMVLGVWATVLIVQHKPESPFAFLLKGEEIRSQFPRILAALVPIMGLALFMPVFTAVKSAIPLFNDYTWDSTFLEMDRAIHGDDPWRLLQPFIGQPWITSLLSYTYHAWFLLIYFGPAIVALFLKDRELRLRFFFGYILTWTIVGMVCAVLFACVGPAFLEPIVGNPHFADQMAYLNAAGKEETVWVLDVQRMLLMSYEQGQYGLGRGITAMPSMHVALCMFYFLFARQVNRWAGYFFFAFMLVIMTGSVHLAYHYALDGYVSIVLVTGIWMATKPLARFVLAPRAAGAAAMQPVAAAA